MDIVLHSLLYMPKYVAILQVSITFDEDLDGNFMIIKSQLLTTISKYVCLTLIQRYKEILLP